MKNSPERLKQLMELARKGQEGATREAAAAGPAAPFGFSTRVAARWAATRGPAATLGDLIERASWWGSALAMVTCVLVLAVYPQAPELHGFDLLLEAAEEQPF
jgi:hypothetical protein